MGENLKSHADGRKHRKKAIAVNLGQAVKEDKYSNQKTDDGSTLRLQPSLDDVKDNIIGLEFVLEIVKTGHEEEPKYVCLLCDKQGRESVFMKHLASAIHRYNYLVSPNIIFPSSY